MNIKKFLFGIAVVLLISGCKKTAVENKDKTAEIKAVQEVAVGDFIYQVKKTSLGIDKELKENMGVDFENAEYALEVFSKKDNKAVQEIVLEDPSDAILSIEKDDKIFENLIKVKFKWNKFTTGPIGYAGYKYYKISKDNGYLEPVFGYFEEAGAQDAPLAEIRELNIKGDKIEIDYQYYESVGMPDIGEGNFKVFYTVNKTDNNVSFGKIECNILRKGKFIDGGYSTGDPKYKIDPPENINYTKDDLNNKFNYLLKEYKFLF